MNFVLDAHGHLYSSYSLQTWVDSAVANLKNDEGTEHANAEAQSMKVVVVVDRADQDTRELLSREMIGNGYTYTADASGRFSSLQTPIGSLYIVHGFQCVAKEGIEVLSIGGSQRPPDRVPAAEQIRQILSDSALPCLPWSPGKWLGQRGRVVHTLLDTFTPQEVTVGDISIRSKWGPPSSILMHARSSGFATLFGTDPLPWKEEEGRIGSFGMCVSCEASAQEWFGPLLTQMKNPMKQVLHGARNSPLPALRRFIRSQRG